MVTIVCVDIWFAIFNIAATIVAFDFDDYCNYPLKWICLAFTLIDIKCAIV